MSGIPNPRGPYSPAVRAGDFIYVSGQGPVDPLVDKIVADDIRAQTLQTLTNLQSILHAYGAAIENVVKCSVFLRNANDFAAMNEVYAKFFGETRPARTTVEAKFHVSAMLVEIDCVAYKP